jgi:ankyrin repeat protein
LWEAATLGLIDRVEAHLGSEPPPSGEAITEAFWGACHGGQRATTEYLLARGADINWIGWDDLTPLDAARRSEAADVIEWLLERDARSARS